MYPNLYYLIKELFGISLPFLKAISTAGFFMALAFVPAAWLWEHELKHKEKIIQSEILKNPNDNDLKRKLQNLKNDRGLNLEGTKQQAFNTIMTHFRSQVSVLRGDYIRRIDTKQVQQLQKAIDEKNKDSEKVLNFESLIENITDKNQ